MVKNDNEINFTTDKHFSGEFEMPGGAKIQGKLIYKKNKNFSLKLFSDIPFDVKFFPEIKRAGEKINIHILYGKVFDENDNTWYISIKDCEAYNTIISSVYQYQIYFPYIIFSKNRTFNFNEDKNLKIDLYFNIWDEFCHPQGFKREAKYVPKELDVKLENGLNISFEQEAWTTFLHKENIFDSLFIARNGVNESLREEINQKLKEVLASYESKIDLKLPEKHKWYLSLNNFFKIGSLREICWYLEQLIICLTNDFATSLEKIIIHTKYKKNPKDFATFYFLFNKKLSNKDLQYHNLIYPFKMKTFSKEEWKTILNNLFKYKQKLDDFFFILLENNKDNTLSGFHIARYIDAIAAIGISKKYGPLKYELVLKNYFNDFNKNDKKEILDYFRKNLDYIKPKNKKNKKNWGLIGIKLCELRALSVHFEDKQTEMDFQKVFNIYPVFKLIIFDYIFEKLGIDKNKRQNFKNYYVTRLFNLNNF